MEKKIWIVFGYFFLQKNNSMALMRERTAKEPKNPVCLRPTKQNLHRSTTTRQEKKNLENVDSRFGRELVENCEPKIHFDDDDRAKYN